MSIPANKSATKTTSRSSPVRTPLIANHARLGPQRLLRLRAGAHFPSWSRAVALDKPNCLAELGYLDTLAASSGVSGRCYRSLSVAVVTRLAKDPAAEFAVLKISAKSGVVISPENIRIIYRAPNDIQFGSCPKLFEFSFPKSSVDRI
jgi:hypothetical protein